VHLDRKMRREPTRMDSVLSTEADDTEDAEERRGTFKHGDLYKMHAYSDAIPNVRSVWGVYPGDDVRFFSVASETALDVRGLPAELDGVGSIPLRPDDDSPTELRAMLARLLNPEGIREPRCGRQHERSHVRLRRM
jgi:predicted component of viral defense system (DUF524 family)